MKFLRNNWPVVAALALLWATIFVLLKLSLAYNQGHLVYALDDGYVEMAIARNFSRFGVWGVTRYGFTSATSSILWPLLLSAIYAVFGVNEVAPFILNIICATLVVIIGHVIIKSMPLGDVYRFLLLLALIFLVPLPALVFTGMEHVAHILLTIVIAFLSAGVLARQSFSWGDRDSLALLALAPLLTLVRYEGMALIAVVCVLLLLRRRVVYSLLLGLTALAPIGIYGLISVRQGAYWLPNSVLLKAGYPVQSITGLLKYAAAKFLLSPHLSLLILLALGAYLFRPRRRQSNWIAEQTLLVIFVSSSILHLVFAAVGWFYRYEAYLVALGLLVNGKLLCHIFSAWADSDWRQGFRVTVASTVLPVLIIAATFALLQRGMKSFPETPRATSNIYQQQYQMGRFLHDHYDGEVIAANDIGAINVLADIKCLDVFGLASNEVAHAKFTNHYDSTKVYELAKAANTRIAIVYDEWLDRVGGAPHQWTWLREWQIPDNVVCGSDRVEFYAVDPAEIESLRSHLQAFSSSLPAGVTERACGTFPLYNLGTRVDLTKTTADQYLCRGWSGSETTLRWSDKKKAFILFALDEIKASTLRIRLTPFVVPGKVPWQRLKVSLNDQTLSSLTLSEAKELALTLPANLLRNQNTLVLELPDATSPMLLGIGPDERLLGVNAEWLEIKPEAGGR